ncbi:hypothetical protein [Coleofasciculus sp.]|uniref:hypothetical protein n=1 Tax=Coleofasciculus sp. TaxID=3100458 RepID=UPI003A13C6F9
MSTLWATLGKSYVTDVKIPKTDLVLAIEPATWIKELPAKDLHSWRVVSDILLHTPLWVQCRLASVQFLEPYLQHSMVGIC